MTMNRKTQRGMGIWGYLWLLLLVASVVTLVLRLGPHYLTNRTVNTVITGMASEPIHKMDKRAIRELLAKRFKINSLYDLEPKSIVDIERTKEWTKLIVNYEVREPIVYNVDAMLTFHDELQFQ